MFLGSPKRAMERETFDLQAFGLKEVTLSGAELRRSAGGCVSLEEVGERVVRFFFDRFRGADGQPAFALARLYKTHMYRALPPDVRAWAAACMSDGIVPFDTMKCLTLLASAGTEPAWNEAARSKGHRAIPLPSAAVIERLPMVAQLIHQLGLETAELLQPSEALLLATDRRTFDVFHVQQAAGSPYIPAQDFVEEHGVRSVVGFGGLLPRGELFAVVLFARVEIPRETAELFKTLALNVKTALIPFSDTAFTPPRGLRTIR